jgi:hypothetical protein
MRASYEHHAYVMPYHAHERLIHTSYVHHIHASCMMHTSYVHHEYASYKSVSCVHHMYIMHTSCHIMHKCIIHAYFVRASHTCIMHDAYTHHVHTSCICAIHTSYMHYTRIVLTLYRIICTWSEPGPRVRRLALRKGFDSRSSPTE